MAVPPLMRRPRRFAGPNLLAANPKLEPIHQSLYSAGSFASGVALPRELLLFQYAVGNNIPGASGTAGALTNAHLLSTNMRTAGFLAAPKVFSVEGIRLIYSQLATPTTAGASPVQQPSLNVVAAGVAAVFVDNLVRTHYSGVLDFSVGPKNYQEAPLWMFPSNTGLDGVASIAGAWAVPVNELVTAVHSGGRYFGLGRYPVLIPAQQQFQVTLKFPSPTNPTLVGAAGINDLFVWVCLDGVLGREVS